MVPESVSTALPFPPSLPPHDLSSQPHVPMDAAQLETVAAELVSLMSSDASGDIRKFAGARVWLVAVSLKADLRADVRALKGRAHHASYTGHSVFFFYSTLAVWHFTKKCLAEEF